MKRLNDLYPGIGTDIVIKSIKNNASEVSENCLFVCTVDKLLDGHNCIDEAIKNGAVAIVVSKDIFDSRVAVIKVPDTNREFPYLCQKFYDYPDRALTMIGVSGTDGKTCTSTIIQTLLGSNQCGCISTNGRSCAAFNDNSFNTISDASKLYNYLDEFRKFGCKYAVLEASDSDLEAKKFEATSFNIAVYTNIINEFLDNNNAFLDYFNTKMKLFGQVADSGFCILNRDDQYFETVKEKCTGKVLTYGMNEESTLQIIDYKANNTKTLIRFKYNNEDLDVLSPLLADFNVYNLAAALLTVLTLGYRFSDLKEKLENILVPGRMEMLKTDGDYYVMVDYAHTYSSIIKLINYIHTLDINNIIVVIGNILENDHSKLDMIGKTVCDMASYVIFTYDDVSNMELVNNVNMMLQSVTNNYKNYTIVQDRVAAINKAIELAQSRDIVLVLGKGRESYNKLGFNDIDVSYQGIADRKIKEESNI